MKIKTTDIARELGISKATVSLALNNRPGVSARTREKILECKKRLEERQSHLADASETMQGEQVSDIPGMTQGMRMADVRAVSPGMQSADIRGMMPGVQSAPAQGVTPGAQSAPAQIKVIYVTRGLSSAYKGEIDLSTAVLQTFVLCAKKRGYSVSISVNDLRKTTIREMLAECREENVKGIILHATELRQTEIKEFEQLPKPMVIYDNLSAENLRSCVVAANEKSLLRAVDHLAEREKREILYLAHGDTIYNFESRRQGYLDAMQRRGLSGARILTLGSRTEEIYQNMKRLLEEQSPAESYIMENYQVSVGVIRAFQEKKIRIPEEVSLIGIDEIPAYMTGNLRLTSVAVPHAERARLAMLLLLDEMENDNRFKSVIYTDCPLHQGKTTAESRT